jgi:AI-2 transport system ATP-binding protein
VAKNLLKLRGIEKSFHRNRVLQGISLDLNESEVVAIIGGNGAGKSTLMKILAGIYKNDAGSIEICGEKVENFNPFIAHEKGIYLVPQEPLLFPHMTVEENLTIGFSKPKSVVREETKKLMEELGWDLDLDRLANSLTIAEQQQLEIIKGLLRKAKVLILDEPTSALTFSETESLFKVIETLKTSGIGIFYITHRLEEVFKIATHAVILRDGKITLKGTIDQFTSETFIEGLLPSGTQKTSKYKPKKKMEIRKSSEVILKVENITGDGFRNISIEIYKGEVVGLAGLVGAGRTEIAEAIYGMRPIRSGKVYLNGMDITKKSVKETIDSGLVYISEDRFLHGIFPISSVKNNITAQIIKGLGFFTKKKLEEDTASTYVERLHIKIESLEDELRTLSGGNQQKAMIARALSVNPKLIIMDEPTRGIDVNARGDIYSIISELKHQGCSILLISSDLEEIERISDRVYAIYQGTCRTCLESDDINPAKIMSAVFGTYEGRERPYVEN